ncbi:unnamed protein product [Pleuronectes platessa]|uniref:Uncharacterized protein n=1 Tax=Pleuronectes platessa TaxID=8262 RepID=A0A9N7UMV5_PLEPL|nr:unnamed protein product [Pleuronectes platessa]
MMEERQGRASFDWSSMEDDDQPLSVKLTQREQGPAICYKVNGKETSPVIEGEGQSQVEPEGLVPTGPPERGSKHPKKDDAYKQTKARLEIRLLKAKLGQAGLSTADEADDDDEEEGELIRRTSQNKN